jgi:lipopolysaccharide/colanic/teichoic acid biosynthesis glycosyltransferase
LYSASIFVTQISLIFLLFGIAINSSPKEDILYYFHRIGKSKNKFGRMIQPLLRIGLFVFYLLPKSINIQQETRAKLSENGMGDKYQLKKRINMVIEKIYLFVTSIIILSENSYSNFIENTQKNTPELTNKIFKVKTVIVVTVVIFYHSIILWS